MKPYKFFSSCFFLLFFLTSSCMSGGNLFVLLPDPDGQTGRVLVSNPTGTQLLTEPRQATEITKAGEAPSAPFMMEEKQIRDLFGPALEAQPIPVVRFLLYFETGSTELTQESQKLVPEILKTIKTRNSNDVSIVGHTDRVGTREANFILGWDRAALIKDKLIAIGLDPQMVEVASHGEDNPLVKTNDDVPEPRNRRVEITIR